MKQFILLLVCSLLYLQANSQIQARNDTFYLRNDSTANYRLDVKNNDSSGSKLYIFYFFKTGANATKYKIERSSDSAFIILTDTVLSTSYSGEFKYFCKDALGTMDSATVFFSRIALTPEVRPGETNLDNLVNHFDIFPIGLNYGQTGSPRHIDDTNIVFTPKRVGNWFFQPGAINAKHSDIDGNGKIDNLDFERLKLNIGNVSGTYKPKLSPVSSSVRFDIDVKDTIEQVGDTLRLPLSINSPAKPFAYGLGYSISVENQNKLTQLDTFYPKYQYKASSDLWVKPSSGSKELFFSDEITRPNHKNIAYCRTDHSNDSMSGGAGIVEIVVTEILIGIYKESDKPRLKINIKDVALIDKNYNAIPISPISKTIYLKKLKSSVSSLNKPLLQVYPTLIDHQLVIEKNGLKNESYAIYNSIGQLMQSGVLIHPRTSIENIEWHAGVYYLKLDNSSESIKIQKR